MRTSFPRPLAEFPTFALVREGATVQFPDTEADDVPPAIKQRGKCDFCGESGRFVSIEPATLIPSNGDYRAALICDRCMG